MGDASVCVLGGVWALGSQRLQGLWLGVASTVATVAAFLVASSRPWASWLTSPLAPSHMTAHFMASCRHILLSN